MTTVNIHDACVQCGEDTSFGSGNFVNRIPADNDVEADSPLLGRTFDGTTVVAGDSVDGYMCAGCQTLTCDHCGRETLDYTLVDNGVLCDECGEA